MPQARKSARSTSRSSATYKEPAALKRLNTSLESAQKAVKELQAQAGRNAAVSTRALHRGLGKFLTDARRDAGKFTTALKRDFEAAQKAAKKAGAGAAGGRAASRSTTRSARSSASRGTKSSSTRTSKPASRTASKSAAKPRARSSASRTTRTRKSS